MKPKILHQQAMELSFKAKQAFELGDHERAFHIYTQAAELESEVAEFYFDKPDIEPTRSILIRSAAFLNLKAGQIERSQHFIFFGLLYCNEEQIKSQLNDALEFSISLKNFDRKTASKDFSYLTALRQNSIHYILEPVSQNYGTAIPLEMITNFSESYIKALKAYSYSAFKRIESFFSCSEEEIEIAAQHFKGLTTPLISNTAYGSFKFSVANDFLPRLGESKELVHLKANIVNKFHHEIFINPLSESDISLLKKEYSDVEINEIFRPLTKIKSVNSPYKIGYYDKETLSKVYVNKIINSQKKDLLPLMQISKEDIGFLESSIIHRRSSKSGKSSRNTIFKEELKSYEFDIKSNHIEPIDTSPLILSEEILINVSFDSEKGFTFHFDDLNILKTDIDYNNGLSSFYTLLYEKIISITRLSDKNEDELKDWTIIKRLINNPESLTK